MNQMKILIVAGLAMFTMISSVNADGETFYKNSTDFLKAEGKTCEIATDGCNTIHINNGELGASTLMACFGDEKWSCIDEKLENEKLGFLSDNDRNQYKVYVDRLGTTTSKRIEEIISEYGSKVLESKKWDTEKSVLHMENMAEKFDAAIDTLIMSYPADSGMSEKDTKNYYILTVAKYELLIAKERWKRNSGIN